LIAAAAGTVKDLEMKANYRNHKSRIRISSRQRWCHQLEQLRKERESLRAALMPRSIINNSSDGMEFSLTRDARDPAYRNRAQYLRRLHQIDEAIDRIIQGLYGYCSRCGNKLSADRLQKDAAITRCAACLRIMASIC
jgi:RNA polymerase-binding transcription factor DksA